MQARHAEVGKPLSCNEVSEPQPSPTKSSPTLEQRVLNSYVLPAPTDMTQAALPPPEPE